jgi:protein-tyrosine phosphatase
VHCAAGMQRSATIVGMFLIATKGMTWQQVINFIQGIRPIAFRDQPNFKDSLIAFNQSYQREILPHISEPI